jgi:hypothetical protein
VAGSDGGTAAGGTTTSRHGANRLDACVGLSPANGGTITVAASGADPATSPHEPTRISESATGVSRRRIGLMCDLLRHRQTRAVRRVSHHFHHTRRKTNTYYRLVAIVLHRHGYSETPRCDHMPRHGPERQDRGPSGYRKGADPTLRHLGSTCPCSDSGIHRRTPMAMDPPGATETNLQDDQPHHRAPHPTNTQIRMTPHLPAQPTAPEPGRSSWNRVSPSA